MRKQKNKMAVLGAEPDSFHLIALIPFEARIGAVNGLSLSLCKCSCKTNG